MGLKEYLNLLYNRRKFKKAQEFRRMRPGILKKLYNIKIWLRMSEVSEPTELQKIRQNQTRKHTKENKRRKTQQ